MRQTEYESVRLRCGTVIESLGDTYPDLIHITSDGNDFTHRHRDRHYDVGIAESNLINVAAGISLKGLPVVVNGISSFVLNNAYLQIRNDICYHNLNVTILGIGSGLSFGHLGFSHHSLEDIATMYTLPGMKIYLPADAIEAEAALRDAVQRGGPSYIRVRSGKEPIVYGQQEPGSIMFDEPHLLKNGTDLLLIAYGATVYNALQAAEELDERGISTGVLNIRSLRMYALDKLKGYIEQFRGIVVVEEHYVDTGVGSIITSGLYEAVTKPVTKLGMPHEFVKMGGSAEELMEHFGLDKASVVRAAQALHKEISNA